MEQLLNAIWVFAVGAIALVVAARPRRRHPPIPYIFIVILTCVALLLFPIISASDDLHPACELNDDASWRHDKHWHAIEALAVLILISREPVLLSRLGPMLDGQVSVSNAQPGHLRLPDGRSPPARI